MGIAPWGKHRVAACVFFTVILRGRINLPRKNPRRFHELDGSGSLRRF